jgi:hypothetical protein
VQGLGNAVALSGWGCDRCFPWRRAGINLSVVEAEDRQTGRVQRSDHGTGDDGMSMTA